MKKVAFALGLLGLSVSAAWAQTTVQLYGILDGGVRITNNEGAAGSNSGAKVTRVIGGGMSSSRFGLNVSEDLGDGLKALANLEHRVNLDTGAQQYPTAASVAGPAGPFWQQSWVGLQGGFGRITLGRQYNVLFDLVTTSYASYPYSPYFDAYKPEIGLALTARADNMVKYLIEQGPFRAELQVSAGEGNASYGGKTVGGLVRYSADGLTLGVAQQSYEFGSGKKLKGTTFGGSYRTGPWYMKVGYGLNKVDAGITTADALYLNNYLFWGTFGNGGIGYNQPYGTPAQIALSLKANKRQLATAGVGYQLTPQLNIGGHYYKGKQTGTDASVEVKADFLTLAADYAFSKRTDAYLEFDHTKLDGVNASLNGSNGAPNGKKTRDGMTIGIRHRF